MNHAGENQSFYPFEELHPTLRHLDPCIFVIFGATGDLTARKLMPALYHLKRENQLPEHFACCGFARSKKTETIFRKEMKEAVASYSRNQPIEEKVWETFAPQIFYHSSEFDSDDGYDCLAKYLSAIDAQIDTRGNRIYYLATQPCYFATIVEKLKKHRLLYTQKEKWARVIIEKPFGHDLNSAIELQKNLTTHLSEKHLYRIDHYLGKETVQNLLVFRFGNALFENLWNHRYIDHVQVAVAEDIGIEKRGHFYEEQGFVRDIMQNHMMQLLSLIAMEPPANLRAGPIHDEKAKVLEALRPFKEQDFETSAVRGQYGKGWIEGKEIKGYREEQNVHPDSQVETYAALRLFIDNWRWSGVPFYFRGGKRLPKRVTEIAITFKAPPKLFFPKQTSKGEPNVLVIRIQPNEGISLKINCKVPGPSSPIQPVEMDFRYGAFFNRIAPDAYERLICDCIAGDPTLFAREDEVLNSWKFLTPILDHWAHHVPNDFPNYSSGTWGPKTSDAMLARDRRQWRTL